MNFKPNPCGGTHYCVPPILNLRHCQKLKKLEKLYLTFNTGYPSLHKETSFDNNSGILILENK